LIDQKEKMATVARFSCLSCLLSLCI